MFNTTARNVSVIFSKSTTQSIANPCRAKPVSMELIGYNAIVQKK